jgi:16S rRNA processing protein RimM
MTEFAERFDPGARLRVDGVERVVSGVSWHKGQARVSLEGIDSLEAAQSLKWTWVEALAEEHPPLEDGEYYSPDLIGLIVYDESGACLGPVDAIVPSPAHDLIQVGDTLIPAARAFVREVDLAARRMTVRLIPGMRPGESAVEA